MQKQKLNLESLRVQSFVTSLDAEHNGTLQGGFNLSWIDGCRSALIQCDPVFTPDITRIRTLDCGSVLDACPSALSCPFQETVGELIVPIKRF